jgi:hypothetical protein
MHPLLLIGLYMLAALLAGAGAIHIVVRLGKPGRAVCDWLAHAPGLDVLIFYFSIIPLVVGPIAGARTIDAWWGWLAGLGVAVGALVLMLMIWTVAHELANPKARKKKRLVHQINSSVGRWRNHTAVWITALAVPLFAGCRLVEYLVYPSLTVLVGFPKYKSAEWVNVSRHKFEGLVGHDLLWCLYCDWMTGVWSLGTEMLRNVESFWCPIRFDSSKKCVNCTIDFPDIDGGWTPSDGTIEDARAVHAAHYPGPGGENAWFGHPGRQSAKLTVEGEPTEP